MPRTPVFTHRLVLFLVSFAERLNSLPGGRERLCQCPGVAETKFHKLGLKEHRVLLYSSGDSSPPSKCHGVGLLWWSNGESVPGLFISVGHWQSRAFLGLGLHLQVSASVVFSAAVSFKAL